MPDIKPNTSKPQATFVTNSDTKTISTATTPSETKPVVKVVKLDGLIKHHPKMDEDTLTATQRQADCSLVCAQFNVGLQYLFYHPDEIHLAKKYLMLAHQNGFYYAKVVLFHSDRSEKLKQTFTLNKRVLACSMIGRIVAFIIAAAPTTGVAALARNSTATAVASASNLSKPK